MRRGPNQPRRVSTSLSIAPTARSSEPMSTPKAMRSPASARMSPKPSVTASTVPSTPRPVASPTVAAARASTTAGWRRTRTMRTTATTTISAVADTRYQPGMTGMPGMEKRAVRRRTR